LLWRIGVWPFSNRRWNALHGRERMRTRHESAGSTGKCKAWPLYCVVTHYLTGASLFCSGRLRSTARLTRKLFEKFLF
jgi:hypothetical protein